MTEKPIWDTPRCVGLLDTREYSDVRHICFKFKTTFESLCKVQKLISLYFFPEFAYRLDVVRGLNSHGGLYFLNNCPLCLELKVSQALALYGWLPGTTGDRLYVPSYVSRPVCVSCFADLRGDRLRLESSRKPVVTVRTSRNYSNLFHK